MKKYAWLIGLLLIASTVLAGTDWFKTYETYETANLTSNWIEYPDNFWHYHYAYFCNVTIPDNATAPYSTYTIADYDLDRPYLRFTFLINNSNTSIGVIFNFYATNAFYLILPVNNYWTVMEIKENSTTIFYTTPINTTRINFSKPLDCKFYYNRYTGHILFKCWDFEEYEPLTWDVDYTNSSLKRDIPLKCGLFVHVNETNLTEENVAIFTEIFLLDASYDTTSAGKPIIRCPMVNASEYEEIENKSLYNQTKAYGKLDLQAWETYSTVNLSGNDTNISDVVWLLSGWNYTEKQIGFIFHATVDISNDTNDALVIAVDKDISKSMSVGDKLYIINQTSSGSYTWNGSDWVEDSTNQISDYKVDFSTSYLMHRPYRLYSLTINLTSMIPNTIDDFIRENRYVYITIYTLSNPILIWNSWNEETNTTISFFDAFDMEDWGILKLAGYTPSEKESTTLDLSNITISTVGVEIAWHRMIYHIPRYKIDLSKVTIEKIVLPKSFNYTFLIFKGTASLKDVRFFIYQDGKFTEFTTFNKDSTNSYILTSLPSDGYLVVVPNPAFYDRAWVYNLPVIGKKSRM